MDQGIKQKCKMADQNKVISLQALEKIAINVNEICRFCLSDTKSNITINDRCPSEEFNETEEYSIYNFVTKLNLIKMEESKNFPLHVCENCYSFIKVCKDFSQLCQKSDTFLRNCYEFSIPESEMTTVQKNEAKINITIQTPNAEKQKENLLNDGTKFLPSKKLNISNEILKVNKSGVKILDVYQQLQLLSDKIKETQSKLTKEDINSVVKNNQHACNLCSLTFSSVKALNYHNVVVHSQERYNTLFKYQYKNPQKSCTNQAQFKKRYKIIHKVNQSEAFKEYLNNQEQQAIDLEKFICSNCNPHKEFKTQNELVQHLLSHKLNVSQNLNAISENETVLKNLSESNMLICMKSDGDSVCHNLTDLSVFINTLDSAVDSLVIALQEKQSSFSIVCKNCSPPLKFTSTDDFIKHINTHHDALKLLKNWLTESKGKKDGSWCCAICPASYTRKQSLYCHVKEKHNPTVLDEMKCPEPDCSKSFNTNRQLIQHGIVAHKKYFAYFHKVFKNVLQTTNEEDNRVKNFECDICQKKYFYKTSLRKHIFGSHLEKSVKDPVVCSYCGKTLSSKLNMKSHIEFVHEALFVSCPICKKKINFRSIGKHYKTHKTNSEMVYSKNSFLCNLCGKILKSKRSFEDHQKLHKNIRNELCDICGSGFTTKKFLRIHKKIHEGAQRKIFNCHQCDKVFSGRQTLNRHLLTHSGKKNFICEICSKCFYTLQELNHHVRYHKKEYRFDCQLCDMRFLDKSRFRHHMMRHRNVRPHKCQFCEKMFIIRGKLNLHMATKHNVEVENRKGVWKDPKTYVPLDDLL